MTMPPQLMAALQSASQPGQGAPPPGGAPAGPDPSGGALPPELMNSINQDAQQLDPTQSGGQDQSQSTGHPIDFLQSALDALGQYQQTETDNIDLAEAAKIYALIQKLLAKDQQQKEAAAGVTAAHKGMAKAYGAGPAAAGSPAPGGGY